MTALQKKVDNVAKLFRPKTALCGESFVLELDEFIFISHPVNNMDVVVTTESKVLTDVHMHRNIYTYTVLSSPVNIHIYRSCEVMMPP